MNSLILNRETFEMPSDGWYQLAPMGRFPHDGAGVVQLIDGDACRSMASAFGIEVQNSNFAGLLIDFDHFSLDGKQKSEAAGWIVELQARDDGLWGKVRWSDIGEDSVRGGRYRFISPVWNRSDCDVVGVDDVSGREILRPVRLLNAAVTNDPNIKGMRPLSNRKSESPEKFYRWVLGDSDEKCPSCLALADQVHTESEWEKAGLMPRSGKLYCHKNCHCRMVLTDGPSSGRLSGVPLREKEVKNREVKNNWSDEARAASLAVRQARANKKFRAEDDDKGLRRIQKDATDSFRRVFEKLSAEEVRKKLMEDKMAVRNKMRADAEVKNNWSDEARAASLAVRRAKAAARRPGGVGWKGGGAKSPGTGGDPGKVYQGGSKDFDERTGQRRRDKIDGGGDTHWVSPLPGDYDSGDQTRRILPYPADGSSASDNASEEDFDRTQDTITEHLADASDVFELKYGFRPVDPDDVQQAEEMAGVPEEYRTGGVLSPRELTHRLMKKKYSEEELLMKNKYSKDESLGNNWSDEARARSLEVRRANAAARRDRAILDAELAAEQSSADLHEAKMLLDRMGTDDFPSAVRELMHISGNDEGEAWLLIAAAAFEKEHGREIRNDTDAEEAERLVGVPREYSEVEEQRAEEVAFRLREQEREDRKIETENWFETEAPLKYEQLQEIVASGGELSAADKSFMDFMERRKAEDEAMIRELKDAGISVQNRKRGTGMKDAKNLVERLANALRFEKAKNKILLGEVVELEEDIVNRRLADASGIVTDENRGFWRDQLLTNRAKAEKVLSGMLKKRDSGVAGSLGRKPMHNRRDSRIDVAGASVVGAGNAAADSKAVQIRNRAHALSKVQGIPFSVAFRRAEKELLA